MKTKIKYSFIGIFLRSLVNGFYTAKGHANDRGLGFIYFANFFLIRGLYGLTFLRNKIKENKFFFKSEIKNNYSKDEETISKVIQELCLKGYSGEYKFKDNIIEKIKDQFIKNIDQSTITYNDGSVVNLDRNQIDIRSSNYEKLLFEKKIYIIKSSVEIKNNSFLKECVHSEYFINLAQGYLNSKRLSVNCTIFFSNNSDQKLNNSNLFTKAAQKYHFDIDYKKFFKILIYFTDVNEVGNGAHIYIPTTHKKKNKEHQITNRFEDYDIETSYPNKKIFIGDKGTFFFVDTFGFHKGSPVKSKPRVAAFIEYGRGHFQLTKNTIFI